MSSHLFLSYAEPLLVCTASAGMLALVHLGLRFGWGRKLSFRIHYVLGLLVLVRCCLPLLPQSRWSWLNWLSAPVEQVAPSEAVAVSTVEDTVRLMPLAEPIPETVPLPPREVSIAIAIAPSPSPSPSLSPSDSPVPFVPPAVSPPPSPVEAPAAWSMASILVGVWLFGAVSLVLVAVVRQWQFHRRLRRAALGPQQIPEAVARVYRECLAVAKIRREPRLRLVPGLESPCVFGWRRPQLLLAPEFLPVLSTAEWRHIFLHELAHVRAWDGLMNWLILLARAVHWFNPLIWISQRQLLLDRELVRDFQALRWLEGQGLSASREYGGTLLKLATGNRLQPMPPGLLSMSPARKHIHRRITIITNPNMKSHATFRFTLSLAALACLAVPLFTAAVAQDKVAATTPPPVPTSEPKAVPENIPAPVAADKLVQPPSLVPNSKPKLPESVVEAPKLVDAPVPLASGGTALPSTPPQIITPTMRKAEEAAKAEEVAKMERESKLIDLLNKEDQLKATIQKREMELEAAKNNGSNVSLLGAEIKTLTKVWTEVQEQRLRLEYGLTVEAKPSGESDMMLQPLTARLVEVNRGLQASVSEGLGAKHPHIAGLEAERKDLIMKLSTMPGGAAMLKAWASVEDKPIPTTFLKAAEPAANNPDLQGLQAQRMALEIRRVDIETTLQYQGSPDQPWPSAGEEKVQKELIQQLIEIKKAMLKIDNEEKQLKRTLDKSSTNPGSNLPFGTRVAGKKGFVYSPFAPEKGMVDVNDLPSGMKVECPYTFKFFRVP